MVRFLIYSLLICLIGSMAFNLQMIALADMQMEQIEGLHAVVNKLECQTNLRDKRIEEAIVIIANYLNI